MTFELDLKEWVGSQEAGLAGEDCRQNKALPPVRHGENLGQQVAHIADHRMRRGDDRQVYGVFRGRWDPGKCKAKFSLKQRYKFLRFLSEMLNHSFNMRKIDYFASEISTIAGLPKAQLVFGKCLRQFLFSLMFHLPLDYLFGVHRVVLLQVPGAKPCRCLLRHALTILHDHFLSQKTGEASALRCSDAIPQELHES